MVRVPLTGSERERGQYLGEVLRRARGERSITDVAAAASISPETLRKIERGRIPTPAFFTVAAVADVLGMSLDDVLSHVIDQVADTHDSAVAGVATLSG
ncbi:helix-turn-helix domain-containing protein [Phytoactinopolyspora mesophila]|uniref:Helix-turn-helix domain-containing protein n=1 Tax=Phytoactinopolyspora mesophila TaxID=2650750 RepID=A0A7K3M9E7_9ACTN|nr:helix-turn-helix transcriptional regulator [Phytoactinopolyspora mesophila]NDL59971.1 helix-turn-helix domain-containing protein [Phytoactinopolyspora mesophila]